MKWNQVFGGVLIGLGIGLFLGGAIVEITQKWNSTSAAGVCMLFILTGMMAIRRDRFAQQTNNTGTDQ